MRSGGHVVVVVAVVFFLRPRVVRVETEYTVVPGWTLVTVLPASVKVVVTGGTTEV